MHCVALAKQWRRRELNPRTERFGKRFYKFSPSENLGTVLPARMTYVSQSGGPSCFNGRYGKRISSANSRYDTGYSLASVRADAALRESECRSYRFIGSYLGSRFSERQAQLAAFASFIPSKPIIPIFCFQSTLGRRAGFLYPPPFS